LTLSSQSGPSPDPYPTVATDGNGIFLALDTNHSLNPRAIVAQLYDSTGNPYGSLIQINDGTGPAAAMDSNGDFIIAWSRDTDVFMKLYLNDEDDDGVPDNIDNCPNISNPLQENYDNDALGNACDDDDDNDGLLDVDEDYYNTNPNNPDTDNDGLSDGAEVNILGTNPLLADTDGNGIWDGDEDNDGDGLINAEEIRCNSDPADPSSKCFKGLPFLMLLLD